MQGLVSQIQHFTVGDGPGIRTTVFLQGCNLSCGWCHNPETVPLKPTLLYQENLCSNCAACVQACPEKAHSLEQGRHLYQRQLCHLNGACAPLCPSGALKLSGSWLDLPAVMDEILEDLDFYQSSGGGVTISGGEPLLQPAFVAELARACQKKAIPVLLDTAACVNYKALDQVRPFIDLFYIDLKSADPAAYRQLGGDLELLLSNLRQLRSSGSRVQIRLPLVPGFNSSPAQIDQLVQLLGQEKISQLDLLPYHRLGSSKYSQLGLGPAWPASPLSGPELAVIADRFRSAAIQVRIEN